MVRIRVALVVVLMVVSGCALFFPRTFGGSIGYPPTVKAPQTQCSQMCEQTYQTCHNTCRQHPDFISGMWDVCDQQCYDNRDQCLLGCPGAVKGS